MLSNNDLYRKHEMMVDLKTKTYEKVLSLCVGTIKMASNNGELICMYQIPTYVLGTGYPKIEARSCATYVMHKLTKANENLKTKFVEPNVLVIDWRR